ncbi:hypothetical protein Anas_13693 [Armadillidium nasatum]|uniref:Amino acid transporter transmembrane domain-containing protein n=1 Tax=Armadillidium nasatum TaxID=96803 RepID=A0A5N5T814_9CRUS|nr:hypothetical protein Anas_13693 [Armadillidium nasatum]
MSVSGSINLPKGDPEVKNGINMWTAGIFLVAEMAGAGFLALPSAIASTGWIGIPMMFIFCFSLAYAGERLGQCWIILEERWPEYKKSTRQPYMEIAQRSYGEVGRKIILFSVLVTLIGTSIVYIILIAQFLNAFFEDFSICFFTTVISLALIPFTWLGTPKDFWYNICYNSEGANASKMIF